MKSAFRSSVFALTIGLVASVSASAAPLQLGILGNIQVSSGSVNFGEGTNPDGGPYAAAPGTGGFTVAQLASGDVFGVLGITAGQTGAIRSFSTLAPVSPFMTFTGSTVSMTATIPLGDFGPFFLEDTSFGAVASFNVSGNLLSGVTTLGTYQGVFTATFNGINSATLRSTINKGGTVTTAYAATFTSDADATLSAATPEPGTLMLISLPLLGIGLISRRREIKLPRTLPKFLMALIAVGLFSASASAAQLTIGGNLQIGPHFVDFGAGTNPDGGPYVDLGTGSFSVMQIQSGNPFSNLGIFLDQAGTIKSFSSTLLVVPPFMTFIGSTVSMTVTGQVGPFFLQDTKFGAVGSFNVTGNLLSGATLVGTYTGTMSATFVGTTGAELRSQITTDKVEISTPFVGTFDATLSAVPEPGTLAIAGAGLAALVALRRRRSSR